MKKILSLVFCVLSQVVNGQSGDEPLNQLFPIYGITLGETTVEETVKRGFSCKKTDDGTNTSCDLRGLTFWDIDNDGILEGVDFVSENTMPYKWETYFGFDSNQSFEGWKGLLTKLGFTLEITKEPVTVVYDNRSTFSAGIKATSKTSKTEVELDFSFGNKHGEGSTSSSLRSLYGISVTSLERDDAVYTFSDVKKAEAEKNENIFPIYNISLGETTAKMIEERGFPCEKTAGRTSCDVKKLTFWDHDNDGIVEEIYFVLDGDMPHKWETYFGFNPDQSFDSWIAQLKKLEFTIEVTSEPNTEAYDNRDTFTAEVKATSEKHQVVMLLDFHYGNNNQEGSSSKSLRSLYSITFSLPDKSEGD